MSFDTSLKEVNAKKNFKKRVREQYLNGQDAEFFYEDSMTYINELFPNSKLDIQFSLGYCQGDGFNIFK